MLIVAGVVSLGGVVFGDLTFPLARAFLVLLGDSVATGGGSGCWVFCLRFTVWGFSFLWCCAIVLVFDVLDGFGLLGLFVVL